MYHGLYVKFLGKVRVIKVICYMYYDAYSVLQMTRTVNIVTIYMSDIYTCTFIYD